MKTTSDLKIGQIVTFTYEESELNGEIVKLFKEPQEIGEGEDAYSYDVVVEYEGEEYNLSAQFI